jgi:sugar phosphate isomerase/epimerase
MSRLAFSTLGCPGEPVERVVDLATRFGCAVELRCADGEPVSPAAPAAALREIRARFDDAGVPIACVATYVEVAAAAGDPVAAVARHAEIAEALGSPFLRVFGSFDGAPDPLPRAVDRLARAAARLADGPVEVLLETHDAFLRSAQIADILGQVGSDRVGVIWDVVNPWRAGEPPAQTAETLRPWLRHVQLKDVASPGDLTPVLPGEGAVPLAGVLAELDRIGYRGLLCLEWERAWYPHIPPLEAALEALARSLRCAPSPN